MKYFKICVSIWVCIMYNAEQNVQVSFSNGQQFEYGHYNFLCLHVVCNCILTEYLSVFLVDEFWSKLFCWICHYGDKLFKGGSIPEARSMQGFMWRSGCKCTTFNTLELISLITIIKGRHYSKKHCLLSHWPILRFWAIILP